MATKARKPAPKRGKAVDQKAPGAAANERTKDSKPAFGKASPRKVAPAAAKAAKSAARPKSSSEGGSLAGQAVRSVKAGANVAAGAVLATAKGAASLAASMVGRGGSKTKAKAK